MDKKLRVHISPHASTIADDNGIGKVIHAQFKYLPQFGIELVGDPETADIIACHISGKGLPQVDVLHVHGLYWTGDAGSGRYSGWHTHANGEIIESARRSRIVTVPSRWVAEPFKRDMRLAPQVIGHGVELGEWNVLPKDSRRGYILWNKNRKFDVCDPTPAEFLANAGFNVISTFVKDDLSIPRTMTVTGQIPFVEMKELISRAHIYLATTKETFGIGTLEALAAGTPVLGYDHGGTSDLIRHKVNGYLVRPGDLSGLIEGIEYISEHWDELSENARQSAESYAWSSVIKQYADLYEYVWEQKQRESHGVSIVIASYNYGSFVGEAIDSCLNQNILPDKVIVVDDGSTDDSGKVLDRYENNPRVIVIRQANAGVAQARNRGISESKTPYIVCLDADDYLDPRFLESLLPQLIKDPGLGVAYSGLNVLFPNGDVGSTGFPPEFDWKHQANPTNPPSTSIPACALFRRSMWERAGGYKQVYAPAEDAEFWTRGLSVGFRALKVTPEPLYTYRVHEGSASRTKTYKRIDDWHPWMRDRHYPMGSPATTAPLVRSYSSPAVSVIIPVGPGHVRYLPGALDSLLGQNFREWEVIVVDDTPAASDEDAGWGRIYETYPFARFADGPEKGPGAARNVGIEIARAPLLLFLDADDYLQPNALDLMVHEYVKEQKYIYTDWIAVNGGVPAHDRAPEYGQREWFERGLHAVTALIPTEHVRAVGGFDEEMQGWEDWDFFVKLAIYGSCGHALHEPLLVYRQNTGTVREKSLANAGNLLSLLRARYAEYLEGEKIMGTCCGGNGDAIMAAKQALANMNLSPTEQTEYAAQMARSVPQEKTGGIFDPPEVKMGYIGEERGAVSYHGRGGRIYRGGNNDHDRYTMMAPEDVEKMEMTGKWKRVSPPVERIPPPPVVPPPAPEREFTSAFDAIVGASSGGGTEDNASSPTKNPALDGFEDEVLDPVIEQEISRVTETFVKKARAANV